MNTAVILRGPPGCGKTTFALSLEANLSNIANVCCVSADDAFVVHGAYKFNGDRLQQAHNACLAAYVNAIRSGDNVIIVDNVNASLVDIAPYRSVALAFDYDAVICELQPSVLDTEMWSRSTHDISRQTFDAICRRLRATRIPKDWTLWTIRDANDAERFITRCQLLQQDPNP